MEESDEDMEETEGGHVKVEEEEEEDEIIESDMELEGETVEPDDEPPQKVFSPLTQTRGIIVLFNVFFSLFWPTLLLSLLCELIWSAFVN